MSTKTPETLLLAADVGGTNLNLAIMARTGGRIRMVRRAAYRTAGEQSLLVPVLRFLTEGPERPVSACVSGAGPVQGRVIPLTNAPWDIDGAALEAGLGIPVRLINDFTAVGYGALLLDPADPAQLLPLPHLDGTTGAPDPAGTRLLVGAGTGLGVGFVTPSPSGPQVHPSEGGHIGLPMTGEATLDLWRYLQPRFPGPPGAEAAVSGRGIATLLEFLVTTGRARATAAVQAILALPEADLPAAIALADDPACRGAMDLFVDLYARVCAELCAVFLPTGGLYLAGGIAAKNAARFLAGDRFMTAFERNYMKHLDGITRATPVYIIQDYAVSLYGAANAAPEPGPGVPR